MWLSISMLWKDSLLLPNSGQIPDWEWGEKRQQSWKRHRHLVVKERWRAETKRGTQANARHLARNRRKDPACCLSAGSGGQGGEASEGDPPDMGQQPDSCQKCWVFSGAKKLELHSGQPQGDHPPAMWLGAGVHPQVVLAGTITRVQPCEDPRIPHRVWF